MRVGLSTIMTVIAAIFGPQTHPPTPGALNRARTRSARAPRTRLSDSSHWLYIWLITWLLLGSPTVTDAASPYAKRPFYATNNPAFTPVDSALASLRFTLNKTLKTNEQRHLVSSSSFVDPDGKIMAWHDFGNLEGPGWAANAVGGAWEIHRFGAFLGKREWQQKSLAILDHVLTDGFIDETNGFIHGYRDTVTGKLCLNYKHNSDWFCPGSMAKIGYQLLIFADDLGKDHRVPRMRAAAVKCAHWLQQNTEPVTNGWFPRRITAAGKVYRQSPDGGEDPFWQTSADGLYIIQLQAALTARKLADYTAAIKQKTAVFTNAGGIFGSINQDTYDPDENVAYTTAFRTLLQVSEVLKDPKIRKFAYEKCLAGLEAFQLRQDHNGVATRGLLFMERTWDTAYMWENAEAALAYFEAAQDLRRAQPARSRDYEMNGLVILRTAARHHYGEHGFLTEGVDWNNHVGQRHHIDQQLYGAIQYTEPFLNNQHIAEPTLFYLRHLAKTKESPQQKQWEDLEKNLLFTLPPPKAATP
jgi:hypothetical protein